MSPKSLSSVIRSESGLRDAVKLCVQRAGGKFVKVVGNHRQESGLPDCWLAIPGCGSWWLELKYGRNECTKLQAKCIRDMRIADARAAVLRLDGDELSLAVPRVEGMLAYRRRDLFTLGSHYEVETVADVVNALPILLESVC